MTAIYLCTMRLPTVCILVQIPFAYNDGYLSVHYEANKYQDIKLSTLQEEAVW